MTGASSLTKYCNLVCPKKVDALLDDYDKNSDSEYDSDCSDESSTYDSDSDQESDDSDEEEDAEEAAANEASDDEDLSQEDDDDDDSDDDESVDRGGRKNLCSAVMDLLRAFPVESKKQGILEYTPTKKTLGGGSIVYAIQTALPTQTFQDDDKREHPLANTNPNDMLKSILESRGYSAKAVSYRALPTDFFLPVTKEMISSYNNTVMAAVRRNDLPAIQRLYEDGQNMQCCNAFGESLIHTVARRGYPEMLDYLVNQAGVSLRIKCDSGRTVLHDACWNPSPNFDCMRIILQECPDLFLVADNRNHTPLAYAPKDSWGDWCTFLKGNPTLLEPREIVQ